MRQFFALVCVVFSVPLAAKADTARTDPDARWRSWEQHQAMEASSWFGGLEWRSIGPTVQGGRVVDIEVHPSDPYTFYVAYASGGIWKTENNGVTFKPLSDGLPSMISGDIALDPSAPQTLWLGTGEPNASRSSYAGLGVFVSRDGGAHFEHAGLTGADRIARVLVDPRKGERVFVAVQGPLYTPGGMRGIYRTDDSGKSWKQVLEGATEWTGASDLIVDPSNPDTLYAALWERSRRPWNFVEGGVGTAIYKSTDGGDNWTRLADFPNGKHVGRVGLAISAANPRRVYASIDNQLPLPVDALDLGDRPLSGARLRKMSKEEFLRQDPVEIEIFIRDNDFDPSVDAKLLTAKVRSGELSMDALRKKLVDGNAALFDADVTGLEIWRSDDAGRSWAKANREPIRDFTYTLGYYFGQIKAAPDNADRVYVVGVPMAVSQDAGATWSGSVNASQVHVDHHAWVYDPGNPKRIFNGNDGGIDVSYDGGASWLKLDAQPVGQSYTLAVDMAEPYNVYTGLQDNGTWKGSSTLDPTKPGGFWGSNDGWKFISGGDGMQIAVDPRDADVVYTGYQFGWYRRAGAEGGDTRPRPGLDQPALRYNWNTPIQLSAHNPDIVYFGANKLFRSMDRGETWTAISADLTRSKERGDVPFATLTTISESTRDFGLIWTGTDDGLLWVTEDGGEDWREVDKGLAENRWVSRVVASSHVRERAYVSQNGYRDDDMTAHVYVTENLGKSWRALASTLPAEPVNVVREDPVNPDLLYVGTDRGVYVSLDRGDSWQALQQGLPNVPVHDLVVHPRDRELVAGTHGRSVWIVDVLPLQELTREIRIKPAHLFHVADVDYSRGWRGRPDRWFAHTEDQPTSKISFWAADAGAGTLKILDADRRPVRQIVLTAKAGINSVEWDLLVDADAGIAAEAARAAKAKADAKSKPAKKAADGPLVSDEEGILGKLPLAESKRLGHPLYITPGDYTLTIDMDGGHSETAFKVNPPKDFEPRSKPKFKLRGRK